MLGYPLGEHDYIVQRPYRYNCYPYDAAKVNPFQEVQQAENMNQYLYSCLVYKSNFTLAIRYGVSATGAPSRLSHGYRRHT